MCSLYVCVCALFTCIQVREWKRPATAATTASESAFHIERALCACAHSLSVLHNFFYFCCFCCCCSTQTQTAHTDRHKVEPTAAAHKSLYLLFFEPKLNSTVDLAAHKKYCCCCCSCTQSWNTQKSKQYPSSRCCCCCWLLSKRTREFGGFDFDFHFDWSVWLLAQC